MKVICVNYGYKVHPESNEYVKEGSVYTVAKEVKGYSDLAQQEVDCYEFEELDGFFEKGMFMPLSNFDERLIHLLRTKPLRKKVEILNVQPKNDMQCGKGKNNI